MVAGVTDQAGPGNVFEHGAQVRLVAPFDSHQLHTELVAAVPGIQVVIKHGQGGDEACCAEDPAWLMFMPSSAGKAVSAVVKAHVAASTPDRTPAIGGGAVARDLSEVREKLAAGQTLTSQEVASVLAVLLGVPAPVA